MADDDDEEVPTFDALYQDTVANIERLERAPGGDAMAEISGTVLPILKDLIAAVSIFEQEIDEELHPVKLRSEEAHEIGLLLGALAHTDPTMKARVTQALETLTANNEPDDDEPTQN